jgi:membrane protease YdiL (CAAX protease family)
MKTHPLVSIPMIIVIEATANLVIYGAVLREILEWKHRPAIVITVYAIIMVLVSKLYNSPLLILPAFMMAMLEGWVYEYSRSVIPVIIGDVVFWLVWLFLMGTVLSGAWFILVALLMVPGACITLRLMEPYKPID